VYLGADVVSRSLDALGALATSRLAAEAVVEAPAFS